MVGKKKKKKKKKASKDISFLISGKCKYIVLPGKRDLADVVKLRIFRWGDILEAGVSIRGRQEG